MLTSSNIGHGEVESGRVDRIPWYKTTIEAPVELDTWILHARLRNAMSAEINGSEV